VQWNRNHYHLFMENVDEDTNENERYEGTLT